MKFNKTLAIMVLPLLLAGCGGNGESSSTSSSYVPFTPPASKEGIIDERSYEYANKLQKPSELVHNMAELSAIVDYYAFYKIERFTVEVAEDYVYSAPTPATLVKELNYLYWYGELVNGVMGMDARRIDATHWDFALTIYENAINSYPQEMSACPLLFNYSFSSDRTSDYNSFATEDSSLPVCDVATTQQLWYAAEHGYRPNPIKDTPAEKYYNKAKDLLRQIMPSTATSREKEAIIYDYIISTTPYDYGALGNMGNVDDSTTYPDQACASDKAYFIEGFFDNHLVVCDGYSKIFTLLGKMEGLNIVRGSGTSDKRCVTREVAGHAYCYIEQDGIWHLSDPTWSQIQSTNTRYFLWHQYFSAPRSYIKPYDGWDWLEYPYIQTYDPYWYENKTFNPGGKEYNLCIDSQEEFEALLSYFNETTEPMTHVEFYIADMYIGTPIDSIEIPSTVGRWYTQNRVQFLYSTND